MNDTSETPLASATFRSKLPESLTAFQKWCSNSEALILPVASPAGKCVFRSPCHTMPTSPHREQAQIPTAAARAQRGHRTQPLRKGAILEQQEARTQGSTSHKVANLGVLFTK